MPNDSHLHCVLHCFDWCVYSCLIFKVSETSTMRDNLRIRERILTQAQKRLHSVSVGRSSCQILPKWFVLWLMVVFFFLIFLKHLYSLRMFKCRIGANICNAREKYQANGSSCHLTYGPYVLCDVKHSVIKGIFLWKLCLTRNLFIFGSL